MLLIQRPTVTPVDDAVDNRQQFSIEPLEPGFGHTLGNSLRRTLLSSIPGAAVTEVRFDDALHESHGMATDVGLNEGNPRLKFEMSHTVSLAKEILIRKLEKPDNFKN